MKRLPLFLAGFFLVLAFVADEPIFFALLGFGSLIYWAAGTAYNHIVAAAQYASEKAKREGLEDGDPVKVRMFGKDRTFTYRPNKDK